MLADTEDGLTGKEMGDLHVRLAMADPLPSATRPDRLTEAFVERQNKDGSARRIITFIVHAMEPVMYRGRPELFILRQPQAFVGLQVNDKGQAARRGRPRSATPVASGLGRLVPD